MLDLEFHLKSSVYLVMFLVSVLIMTLVILFILPWSATVKAIAIVPTIIYGRYLLKRYGFLNDSAAIIAMRRMVDGRWLLSTKDKDYQAELCQESTVTRLVTVLLFRVENKFNRQVCIVVNDSLLFEQYRRLLVILRMHA